MNPPAAVAHISQVHDQLVDPQVRAQAAAMLGRMLLFTGPAQAAATVVQGALTDLPTERAGTRQALEALELYTVAFGAQVPDAAERLARVRAAGLQKGLGGSMLSAVAAWDWALRGGTAQQCSELALALLADGWLITLDAGFMALVAARVLVVAERDEARTVCESALSAAHQMGSLIGVSSVNVWRGWAWLARGELAEAEDALREGLEGIRLMEEQNGAGMAYAAGFLARVLIERGDLDGAPGRAHELPAADPRLGRRGGGAPHHGRAAARRGPLAAGACRSRAPVASGWATWTTSPGPPGGRSRPRRSTGSSAETKHGRCSRRSWSRRGTGALRGRSRARCGCSARFARGRTAARGGRDRRWLAGAPRARQGAHRARVGVAARPEAVATRGRRSGTRSRSPATAGRSRWPSMLGTSSTPPVPARGARR